MATAREVLVGTNDRKTSVANLRNIAALLELDSTGLKMNDVRALIVKHIGPIAGKTPDKEVFAGSVPGAPTPASTANVTETSETTTATSPSGTTTVRREEGEVRKESAFVRGFRRGFGISR